MSNCPKRNRLDSLGYRSLEWSAAHHLQKVLQNSRHIAFVVAAALVLCAAAIGPAPRVAAAPVAAPASPAVAAAAAAVTHPGREVFGFALASSLADPTIGYPSWNFDLLTTVAYFGLHVNSNGQFASDNGWTTWNSGSLTSLVSIAHQHGVKVVLTVILQDFSPNTPAMCAGLANADTTVAATVQQVKAKGVDGVNIDYEGLDGSCGNNDPYWAQHAMTSFVQKMRAGLGSSYYLSVDTYASSAVDGYGFFDVRNIASYADSLFVMAYDLEYSNYRRFPLSCASFCLGPTAPLSGYFYNDTNVAAQYAAVVGAGKVILGVPYYGRKACVATAAPNAYPTSSVTADSYLDASNEASDPAVQAGSYASHRDANSSGTERWDTWYNTALHCTRELYWDDATSLGKKYDLVNAQNLRGVGIWNLNYGGGAPELWAALARHFATCSSVSISASPASPVAAGASVTAAAQAVGCPSPVYEFWIRAAGSSTWQMVQAYSANPSYRWNSTGAAPGTVYLGVHARDANSGPGHETYGSVAMTVFSPCGAVNLNASPASAIASGTAVTVTATATGCPSPIYEFWLRPQSQATWQMVQSYSATPTYRWNSTGATPGTVYLGVHVRDAASTAAYDGYTSIPATVYSPCRSAGVNTAPASPVAAGTTVTVTGSATGCSNPVYEFWLRPAGSSTWQLVQAYSSSPTFRWNSTGAADGTVYLGVHVRDAGSTAAYDAVTSTAMTVFSPCTSVTISATPTAVKAGATVMVTATVSGCTNAVYEFWIRAAGATTWQRVRAYGSGGTYAWNSSGAAPGTVYVGVHVRNGTSVADYESLASTPVVVS